MHTDTPTGRLILLLSTPNRVFRAARRAAETILPCASDTNSAPQEPLRSLFAKADASAAVADSMPRTQRPRRPFRLHRKTAARRGKRSNEAKRSAEAKPDCCLSQHRRNGVFHTCGLVSSTCVENSTELSTSCGKDSPVSPMGIFSRIGVSGSGVSRLERDRRRPLVADSLALSPGPSRHQPSPLLSAASRHRLPPLCLPPPVTSGLPACSCGFRRSLRPSRSRLARRRP